MLVRISAARAGLAPGLANINRLANIIRPDWTKKATCPGLEEREALVRLLRVHTRPPDLLVTQCIIRQARQPTYKSDGPRNPRTLLKDGAYQDGSPKQREEPVDNHLRFRAHAVSPPFAGCSSASQKIPSTGRPKNRAIFRARPMDGR